MCFGNHSNLSNLHVVKAMTNKRILVVGVIALAIAAAGLFLSRTFAPVPGDRLVIGALYPLTGPAASLGQEFKRGVELAVALEQERGGAVEAVFEDTKTDPNAAIAGFRKLRGQGVRFFLTTVSSTALALQPIVAQERVLMFADVAHPDMTGRTPFIFRHSSTAEQEANVISNYLKQNRIGPRVVILWVNDEYGKAFTDSAARTLPGVLDGYQPGNIDAISFSRSEGDLRPEALKALAFKPDAIVVAGFGKQLGVAISRLRDSGFAGPVIATMGFAVTPDAVAAAGPSAQGVVHTIIEFDQKDELYSAFAKAYRARFQVAPPTYAALSFNSANMIINEYKSGAREPEAMANALRSKPSVHIAGGTSAITEKGDILPPVAVTVHSVPSTK